jgi:polysaccharide pyruvyl transferase WcaK-like protein
METAAPLIVVTDGWLANAGDAAILLAMQDSLRRAIPGVRIVFCAHHGSSSGTAIRASTLRHHSTL